MALVYYTALLFFLMLSFVMPLEFIFLTVNEELFVVISFLLFVDLFGNMITNGIADTADQKIAQILTRSTQVLALRSSSLMEHYNHLYLVSKIINFRKIVIQKVRANLFKALKTRVFDRFYLSIQKNFYENKVELRYNIFNSRLNAISACANTTIDLLNDEQNIKKGVELPILNKFNVAPFGLRGGLMSQLNTISAISIHA